MTEVAMLKVSSAQYPDAATLIRDLDAAVYKFGLDHNARRMPAAIAATMTGERLHPADALPHLEKCLENDPHARDVQAQVAEVKQILRRLN